MGCNFPASIFKAVDFPIPLVPTNPSILPALGIGNLCNLKELGPYLYVICLFKLLGKLMILIAWNGHLLTHNPHPIQRCYEILAILDSFYTSTHCFSVLLIGQDFLH